MAARGQDGLKSRDAMAWRSPAIHCTTSAAHEGRGQIYRTAARNTPGRRWRATRRQRIAGAPDFSNPPDAEQRLKRSPRRVDVSVVRRATSAEALGRKNRSGGVQAHQPLQWPVGILPRRRLNRGLWRLLTAVTRRMLSLRPIATARPIRSRRFPQLGAAPLAAGNVIAGS
jgi:hypothetical protein